MDKNKSIFLILGVSVLISALLYSKYTTHLGKEEQTQKDSLDISPISKLSSIETESTYENSPPQNEKPSEKNDLSSNFEPIVSQISETNGHRIEANHNMLSQNEISDSRSFVKHEFMRDWNEQRAAEYWQHLVNAYSLPAQLQNQEHLWFSLVNLDDSLNESNPQQTQFERLTREVLRDEALIENYISTKRQIVNATEGRSRESQLRIAKEQIAELIRKQLINSKTAVTER